MKQILQNLGNGETLLAEVPRPIRNKNSLLIESSRSLVSIGTEKMLIDFGKSNWIAKARQQPDKVKQVLQKIRTDGLWTTLEAVQAKLDQPISLGYSNVGRVIECDDSPMWKVGQRVVSNGPHAELVVAAPNLVAAIPDTVSDEQASFTVIGAIALQGIRLLAPTLGERFVVSGLGLIGLLAVQILKAHGCEVLGVDFDPRKTALAASFGADVVNLSEGLDPVSYANEWSKGQGVDGVLITASTKSDELIHQAATMCRKRGRIVLVGVIGLNLRRSDFYEKELTFQVSCSYGPGRYDANYEKRGLDYPLAFVRWTEQRNFEAVLGLLASQRLQVEPLISHRFAFADALKAYEAVAEKSTLGVLLQYDTEQRTQDSRLAVQIPVSTKSSAKGSPTVAFIGSGGFSTRMLMPNLEKLGVRKHTVVSSSGVTATHAAKKFGFQFASSSSDDVFNSKEVDTLFIVTPHNSHAKLVCQALEHGKHVFVEKPLALSLDELDLVHSSAISNPDSKLMVGFNRRFSPHTQKLAQWLRGSVGAKSICITVNAGEIPANHWTQDPEVGGGRIRGEACHFVDLARYLAGCRIVRSHAVFLGGEAGRLQDSAILVLGFEDGSIANINYLAKGNKSFPKERIEVFADGNVVTCDNFRVSHNFKTGKSFRTRSQDKGHQSELQAFIQCIQNATSSPIPLDELIEVSKVTIEVASSLQN